MTTLDTLRQLQADYEAEQAHRASWRPGDPDRPRITAAENIHAAAPTHLADLITALEQIERVREVHKPFECRGGCCIECIHCKNEYPCPTIRILDGNE